MILLGSVPRVELIKLIDRQVGKERRMQVVAKWQKEAQERLDEVERRRRENRDRRPSRFEVTPAPDTLQRKYSISSQSLSTNQIMKVLSYKNKNIVKKFFKLLYYLRTMTYIRVLEDHGLRNDKK